jgi:hypothetical protein
MYVGEWSCKELISKMSGRWANGWPRFGLKYVSLNSRHTMLHGRGSSNRYMRDEVHVKSWVLDGTKGVRCMLVGRY